MADLTNIYVGILIFMLFIVGFTFALTDFSSNTIYNTSISSEVNSTLFGFESNLTQINTIGKNVYNSSTGTEATQEIDSGINPADALSALKLVPEVIGVTMKMISRVSIDLGIPPIFALTLVGIFLFTIAIIFISAVLRNRV